LLSDLTTGSFFLSLILGRGLEVYYYFRVDDDVVLP
jgi:hypothetical protein